MNKPLVSVLVLNWNGLKHLQECFTSLLRGCEREDVEFVLLDNASTDESVNFVIDNFSNDPRLVVECLDKNYGWSGGNNRGIKKSIGKGAKYILLLNNDTKIEPNCIEALIEMSESNPDVGGLAPKMLLFDQPWLLNSVGLMCSIIGSAWDRGLGRVDTPRWNEITEVIGICGGAMWLRIDALLKAGYLPEEFSIYLDDLDLCLRIWNAGYRILTCPAAVVHHKFSATWQASPQKAQKKYYLNTRNRFYLIERNFPSKKFWEILFWLKWGEIKAIGNAAKKAEFWRIQKHILAWIEAGFYLSHSLRWRKEQKKQQLTEQSLPPFWKLIQKKPLFCPDIELPVEGWYKPHNFQGKRLFPISKYAVIHHHGGKLSFKCGNMFPQLGDVDIIVKFNDDIIEHIQTTGLKKYSFDLFKGIVSFEANKILESEQTNKTYDIGGWFEFETPAPF